jgi:DNA-directed RNA polymerase sigma subunit (sigma70/sigma32)
MFKELLIDILGESHNSTVDEQRFMELLPEMLNNRLISPSSNHIPIERSISILECRYGLNGHYAVSYERVGNLHGISGPRARQITARTISHLRHPDNRYLFFST